MLALHLEKSCLLKEGRKILQTGLQGGMQMNVMRHAQKINYNETSAWFKNTAYLSKPLSFQCIR
ncbi:MAG: hypothetical protein M3Y81_05865 [Chloroflexota bacterium]|nr:hypothetical protein [Chloroflexota bacterium]